jgi:hypothetical protein
MKVGVAWLAGTFVLFLLVGQVGEVPDVFKLTTYVAFTILCFASGYALKAQQLRSVDLQAAVAISEKEAASARLLVFISAAYYAILGLSLLRDYGASSVGSIVQAIAHPGAAYFTRLRVFGPQLAGGAGSANVVVQLLTLFSVLSTPLVPFLVVYWRRLSFAFRAFALVGLTIYCLYWLYIGTQKGLGDTVVFAAAAALVLVKGRWPTDRRLSKRALLPLGAVVVLFAGYMAFNQGDRLASQGEGASIKPNALVTAIAGEQLGRGVTLTLGYPSAGYLGLAHNLETPFEWSRGRGSSRALDSYATQYLGIESAFDQTYPARTERRMGYPALMYWATIYPWLASDLTFLGAALLMAVVGWWLARLWFEAAYLRRRLSLLLFCQLTLVLAYVPANNQVGITRPGLIAFTSLVAAYVLFGRKGGDPKLQTGVAETSSRARRASKRSAYPTRTPRSPTAPTR